MAQSKKIVITKRQEKNMVAPVTISKNVELVLVEGRLEVDKRELETGVIN